MKRILMFLFFVLVPFLVFGQPGEDIFEEMEIDGVTAEDEPFEYGARFAALIIYLAILFAIGAYIASIAWGMLQSYRASMSSRNIDGSNDNTKTSGTIYHLLIAIVIFIIVLNTWGRVDQAIDEVFAYSVPTEVIEMDNYSHDEISRSV